MQISEHCYALTGLAYTAPWSLNAGFVAGDEITLVVDTAATAMSAATIHGYALAVRPQNRIAVINTERHFDHIGGNSYFRERGAEIYGHPAIDRSEEEFRTEIEEFNDQIPNELRRQRAEAKVFYWRTELALPNRRIAQDTELALGGCEVKVLMTPGHTPSNLSVYVPSDGVVFSGDCVVNGYVPNLECGSHTEWQQWLRSLDRIEKLAPKFIVPGHGPVVQQDEIAHLIHYLRSVLEEALASGRAPTAGNAPGTATHNNT